MIRVAVTARVLAIAALAVMPPAGPVASEPLSATAEAMWAPPVPTVLFRTVAVAGTVQPVLPLVRSDQNDTAMLPAFVTLSAGGGRAPLLGVSEAIWWGAVPPGPPEGRP